MLKDIVEARPLEGHRLYVRFEDGLDGEVDLSELVELRGVFAALRDPAKMAQVTVHPELGTVCWLNGADRIPTCSMPTCPGVGSTSNHLQRLPSLA